LKPDEHSRESLIMSFDATLAVTWPDVQAAARRLEGHAHRTPVLSSRTVDERTGARVFFKCENLQRAGAFKFRGAFNAIAQLPDEQRRHGVLAYSSGNHAQAVALAGRLLQTRATILMPSDAPRVKLEATRGYGAEVITYDRMTQDREALAAQLAHARGLVLIPPFDHPDVIAGQGTAAKELIEEVGQLDFLFVCVGGAGLISGCALAAHALSPGCQVIGVEPEAGNDVAQSLAAGRIVTIATPVTIADGAQTTHPGRLTFPIVQACVSQVLTVPDAQLVRTMRFFFERMKLVVEPTGCLAAAAVLGDAACGAGLSLSNARVGVIISGGNVDPAVFARLLATAEPD
jgi:threo-3-hydroxy-L-aspartate ammonia-lyase